MDVRNLQAAEQDFFGVLWQHQNGA